MKKFLSDVLVDCNLTVSGTSTLGAATGVTVSAGDNSRALATTEWVTTHVSTNSIYSLRVPVGTTTIRLASGSATEDVAISATGSVAVSRVSDSEIRLTGTNNYLNSASFSTSTGVLTLGREGLSNITVDLDNRYLTSESDTLDTVTSRDGVTTNTIGVGTVNVIGTTAGQELLTVDGTNGRLFTVTDDLSDSLFSVNTIAGLPVIEVFADNTIKLGNFANPIEIDSSSNIVIPGTITASGYNDSNWNTAFNDRITAASVSGTSTKTLTLTQGDGSTITASWTDINTDTDGYVSNVELNGNSLDFTGTGSGFAGSIDLSGITTDLTGYATEQYVLDNSDDYGSWNLKTNNVQRTTVQSGGTLDIVAGSNVSVAYSAGGVVTISSTDTNTDTNNYVTGLAFNTGNGVLTATREGLGDLTVDLDGRYASSGHNHDTRYIRKDVVDSFTGLTNDAYDDTPGFLKGVISLRPGSEGGNTGIGFSTTVNVNTENGQDYGYLWWYDDNNNYAFGDGSGENAALILGIQNDSSTTDFGGTQDAIAIESSANIFLNPGLAGIGTGGVGGPDFTKGKVYIGRADEAFEVYHQGNLVNVSQLNNDAGYITGFTETVTSLTLSGNVLRYTDESGSNTDLDLSLYLDDTNLARLTSGTLDSDTGIATFTRDDDSTFTVDFSALFDDVDNYVDSVAFSTTNGVLTIGRTGSLADLTVDLDGRYDLAGTAVTQAGIVNTRIDEEILPAIDGKADSDHVHDYLPLAGGTLSGDLQVLLNDHSTGPGWDTQLYIGKSDTLGLEGAFPTYVPAGSYGFFSHASSDGVFIGSVPVSAGATNYYATIAWGDDATEYLQFLYKGSKKAHLTTEGHFYINGDLYANGGNSTEWNTAFGWGDHDGLYASTSHTHSAADITSGTLDGARLSGTYTINVSGTSTYANNLYRDDNRTIAPSEDTNGTLSFGFTSFQNDNSGPWADYLHLRSYTDSSGGRDNLLMFSKSDMEIRLWQQDFNSAENYAEFRDVAFKDELQVPAIKSNGTTPSLNSGISAAEVRTLIGAGTSSTDTNFYLSGATFNTGNGVLALTVSGATNQSVDLDGRYKVFSEELLPARPEQIAPPDSYPLGLYVTDSESSAPYSWAFDAGIVWGIHPANANNRHLQFISNYDGSELMMRMKNGTADEWRGWNHIATRNWVASQNYLTSIPSEYLTQTEGDARYLQSVPAEYVTATEITNYSISPRFGSTIGMGNDSAIIEFQDGNTYTKTGYWSTLDALLINGDSNSNNNIILRTGNILVNQNQFISGKLGVQGVIELGDNAATTIYMGTGDGDPTPVVIETFSADENIGAFLDFTIYDDDKGNMRAGTLQVVFNGDQVMFNEVNTMDIGDTTPCTLDAVNNAGTIDVRFTTPDPTFHIKYHVRTL